MNLVIVESPSKAKTIEKYLGKGYKVLSTLGHIIDLPSSKLAVNVESGYEPEFSTMKGKATIVKTLKKALPKDGKIYLAMDPDREGEAIAYHTATSLKLKDADYDRVVFYEITKDAVNEAIKKPRKIDQNLVQAQIARRVLDRLVGYKLSELLWKKIWYGLSAGRVQSVALKLIVEREKEIISFIPDEYWDIKGHFSNKAQSLHAKFSRIDDKKVVPKSEKDALDIESDSVGREFKIDSINEKEVKKHAYPPFTTSTLQQAGYNVLGFTAKRTMALAQALYQNGFITYMRTDSNNLSQEAIGKFRNYIQQEFGTEYLPESPNYYKKSSKNAQEAHEAIRPTDIYTSYEEVAKSLGDAEAKLYMLIRNRALASQMSQRRSQIITAYITGSGKSGKKYTFSLGAEKVLFDGFRKVWNSKGKDETDELQELQGLTVGEKFILNKLEKLQNFTKPKARYTDATLVKALEYYGVGRPSTYATIISTIQERGYVTKVAKYLKPTDIGFVVSDFLSDNFVKLVDYHYTAKVEDELDGIADGTVQYVPFLDSQYKPLVAEMSQADKNVDKNDVVILGISDEKCPKCSSEMVIRLGRYGKFLSCSKFPECKGMANLDGDKEQLDPEKYLIPEKCPKCEKPMILKSGKYGKYWACTDYPDCKTSMPIMLKETCPKCDKPLVERQGKWGKKFIGCSGYPDCKYIKKDQKKSEAE